MRDPVPADFSSFVTAHEDYLRAACRDLTRHGQLGDLLAVDLLAHIALRWRWRPANRRERSGAARLRRLVGREVRSWRADDPPPGKGRIQVVVDAPVTAGPFADGAWRRARSIRRARALIALSLIVLSTCVALVGPRQATVVAIPQPQPATLPPGVQVLPPIGDLNRGGSPLPPTLTESTVDLSDQPVRHAVAVLRRDSGPLLVVTADGTRRFNNPALDGTRLLSTSLAPDGRRTVLLGPAGLVVVDLATATVHSVPIAVADPALVWRDPVTVVVASGAGATQVNVDNGQTAELASVRVEDLANARGPDNAALTELVSPLASVARTPRIKVWRDTDLHDSAVSEAGFDELAVFGPPWIGNWTGTGWSTKDLLVRPCAVGDIRLPTGNPRSAVGAIQRNGLYAATLVGTGDTALDVLGFTSAATVLVAARTGTSTAILSWRPQGRTITLVSTAEGQPVISVSDLGEG